MALIERGKKQSILFVFETWPLQQLTIIWSLLPGGHCRPLVGRRLRP